MTPKEKADELVYKFADIVDPEMNHDYAKDCALVSAQECLKCCAYHDHNKKQDFTETYNEPDNNFVTWWQEVKKEIEKL